jgi:hypothetical protein
MISLRTEMKNLRIILAAGAPYAGFACGVFDSPWTILLRLPSPYSTSHSNDQHLSSSLASPR